MAKRDQHLGRPDDDRPDNKDNADDSRASRDADQAAAEGAGGGPGKIIDKPGFKESHPAERERAVRESQLEADEARERQANPPVVTQTIVNPVSTELRDGANQPAAPQQAVAKDPESPREPNQDAPPPRHHQPGLDHVKGRRVTRE
jgi:hypothetical protein